MYIAPAITGPSGYAANIFQSLRQRALLSALWAKLTRGEKRLISFFDVEAAPETLMKTYAGLRDVPVRQIVGTLDRAADFDGCFRPLGKHLRDRWVYAFTSLQTDAWAPIVVHKIEDRYYVEDGHHRVSVANYVGMAFIQAEVWEHTPAPFAVSFPQPALQMQTAECDATMCAE